MDPDHDQALRAEEEVADSHEYLLLDYVFVIQGAA
jgi:hypothetical protein